MTTITIELVGAAVVVLWGVSVPIAVIGRWNESDVLNFLIDGVFAEVRKASESLVSTWLMSVSFDFDGCSENCVSCIEAARVFLL